MASKIMKYVCMKCGAEFEHRCPDGPKCKLDHPCIHCNGEVQPKSEDVVIIENPIITGYSLMPDGSIEVDGYYKNVCVIINPEVEEDNGETT